jgi:hypothetical protein
MGTVVSSPRAGEVKSSVASVAKADSKSCRVVEVDARRVPVERVGDLGTVGGWNLGMLRRMPWREFHAISTTPVRAGMPHR